MSGKKVVKSPNKTKVLSKGAVSKPKVDKEAAKVLPFY